MIRAAWQARLEQEERRLSLSSGFKFVYGPWATLTTARIAFLSLNPGAPPDGADLRTVSDERGNSYVVEQATTRSPITDQYLRLAALLGVDPSAVLAGVVNPFRSASAADLTAQQQAAGLALGEEFWRGPLSRADLQRIVTSGREAGDFVARLLGARLDAEVASGWGTVTLRRLRTHDGRVIVQLPHLSRFKLLSRPACVGPLRAVFGHGA